MSTLPSKHHQPLHNFSLPFLKWGHRFHSANHHHRRRHRTSPHSPSDLNHRRKPQKTEINEQNAAVSPHGGDDYRNLIDAVTAANGDVKPWNLRPRRLVIDSVDGNSNDNGDGNGAVAEEEKKTRLWIALSKEEIEEDIYAFTGSRPSRRPKKRNKIAQKHLDNVFPGLYLVGASADSYRV